MGYVIVGLLCLAAGWVARWGYDYFRGNIQAKKAPPTRRKKR